MYSGEPVNLRVPRGTDGGRAGALIRPVFSISQLSAKSGHWRDGISIEYLMGSSPLDSPNATTIGLAQSRFLRQER
jgi:hypothetical protein